jgi:hypothetical protein
MGEKKRPAPGAGADFSLNYGKKHRIVVLWAKLLVNVA